MWFTWVMHWTLTCFPFFRNICHCDYPGSDFRAMIFLTIFCTSVTFNIWNDEQRCNSIWNSKHHKIHACFLVVTHQFICIFGIILLQWLLNSITSMVNVVHVKNEGLKETTILKWKQNGYVWSALLFGYVCYLL